MALRARRSNWPGACRRSTPRPIELTDSMPFGNLNGTKSSISMDKAGRSFCPRKFAVSFIFWRVTDGLEIRPGGILLRSHSRQGDLVEENGLLVHEGLSLAISRAGRRARPGQPGCGAAGLASMTVFCDTSVLVAACIRQHPHYERPVRLRRRLPQGRNVA